VSGTSEAPARGLHSTRKATPPGIASTPTGVLPKGNALSFSGTSTKWLELQRNIAAKPPLEPKLLSGNQMGLQIRLNRAAFASPMFKLVHLEGNCFESEGQRCKVRVQRRSQKAKEILWKTGTKGFTRLTRARAES
jgi:hypothetical protein